MQGHPNSRGPLAFAFASPCEMPCNLPTSPLHLPIILPSIRTPLYTRTISSPTLLTSNTSIVSPTQSQTHPKRPTPRQNCFLQIPAADRGAAAWASASPNSHSAERANIIRSSSALRVNHMSLGWPSYTATANDHPLTMHPLENSDRN